MSRDNQNATISREELSIPQVRALFQGHVIAPGDNGYDKARTVVVGGIDRHPAVIIRVANTDDVARAIALARDTGLELAVRSGGHSGLGHGTTEGGILLDLSLMKAVEIDVEGRTAWAETGLTAGEYTAAVGAHGLATGFGDTGSVGIGGITLGGGIGYLVRKHGMTIDNLLAAEIVTADGQLLYTDAETHPDLFWAIRGGGGNFGVATRFKFRLHEVNTIVGGMLVLPATADVIRDFMAAAEAAPEEQSAIVNVMTAPPMPFLPPEVHGKLIVMALMVYAGDVEAGQRALAPFRALAEPIADMLRPMPYAEMFPPEEGEYHPTTIGRTLFLDRFGQDEAETIMHYLETSDAPFRVAQLRVLGGAMARVPVEATAYAHRRAPIMVTVVAFYTEPEEREVREPWVNEFAAALHPSDSSAYVNFLGNEAGTSTRDAYPEETWERLAAIKARYDPTNLFRLNHNIPPAG